MPKVFRRPFYPAALRSFFLAQRQTCPTEQQRQNQAQIAEEGIRQVFPDGYAEGVADEHAADAPRNERVDDRTRIFQRTRV